MIENNNIKTPKNLNLAYRRLLTNPEATYKNYFRSVYAAYGMACEKNIQNLSKRIIAGYVPETSYKVFAPKKDGLSRMYTILSIEDQIVYQAYANVLADQMQIDRITNRYGKSVFGNIYNGKQNDYFFKDWESSFKAYTKAVIESYNDGNIYIASFDLTACYDSINHNLIKDILKKYHFSDSCSDSWIRLLEEWCSPSSKYKISVGIPQGPQASGLLAEAVLGEYDEFIEKTQKLYSFQYFRYVDDIKILAKDEKTIKWVLFLLDKKSKELGLFPQSSKIAIHRVSNIFDEVKQISKPLFDDDSEEDDLSNEAAAALSKFLRKKSNDVTSIKRYFQYLEPCLKNNKLAIRLVNAYPDTLHSFIYYVQRYPRKLPSSIVTFIKNTCLDRNKQYFSGQLLLASTNNISRNTISEFGSIAFSILRKNNKEDCIYDLLFKEQLMLLLVLSGKNTANTFIKKYKKEQYWWIRQQLLMDLVKANASDQILESIVYFSLMNPNSDESLVASLVYVENPHKYKMPERSLISSVAQESLKKAGVIQRSKYTSSQINRYLEIITGEKITLPWKKLLGRSHDAIERQIFAASCYWRTDITAFVNIWDSIDDGILDALYAQHNELGSYTLGSIGSTLPSTRFKSALPSFSQLAISIHEKRLSSYLSHNKVRSTGKYTGPIPYREKKKIRKELASGLKDLESFW